MARITQDLLMDNKAFGKDKMQPMLNLGHGGQFGWSPNLKEWVSNQAYVRRNLVCILLEAPKFFQKMPEPQMWVETLKSLLELHCRSIEGLNGALTVETDAHPVGGAGEMQDEVTNVTRARSEPSFTFVEKTGNPIQTFIYNWITYGLMDPDTKYAMVGTLAGDTPKDMLPDWYSASCLFFEPDPTHRRVVKSWVVTNMFPKETGEIIGKRDLTSASEVLNLTIPFTGIAQFNLGTNKFAQTILDKINQTNANPNLRASFIDKLDSDISDSTEGYINGITDLAKSAIVS
jgi:hypothetical protein